MNFLSHIFLSSNDEQLMVGNFIGDYVKGNQYQNYPPGVRKGILLHRAIDEFTDHNKHWKNARKLIKPVYGRFAGVAADLFLDYHLASNWEKYSKISLPWFSKWAHAVLLQNHEILPERVKGFLPFLIQHKRLVSYAQPEGIRVSLKIMALHTALPDHADEAIELINLHRDEFNLHFERCIIEAISFVSDYLE